MILLWIKSSCKATSRESGWSSITWSTSLTISSNTRQKLTGRSKEYSSFWKNESQELTCTGCSLKRFLLSRLTKFIERHQTTHFSQKWTSQLSSSEPNSTLLKCFNLTRLQWGSVSWAGPWKTRTSSPFTELNRLCSMEVCLLVRERWLNMRLSRWVAKEKPLI